MVHFWNSSFSVMLYDAISLVVFCILVNKINPSLINCYIWKERLTFIVSMVPASCGHCFPCLMCVCQISGYPAYTNFWITQMFNNDHDMPLVTDNIEHSSSIVTRRSPWMMPSIQWMWCGVILKNSNELSYTSPLNRKHLIPAWSSV